MATASQAPFFPPNTISHDNVLLGQNFHYHPGPVENTPSTTTFHTPAANTSLSSHSRDSPVNSHDGQSVTGKRKSRVGDGDGDRNDPDSDEALAALKRQRNTMAARKYRQKRLDRISELEKALEDMTGERDGLKLQLARREAEVEALREMLGRK